MGSTFGSRLMLQRMTRRQRQALPQRAEASKNGGITIICAVTAPSSTMCAATRREREDGQSSTHALL